MESLVKIARMKYEPEENWQTYISDLKTGMKAEFAKMGGDEE